MKKVYQTQQRKELIGFLSTYQEKQFTIEEIIERMATSNAPAPSSIYRLMKQLVEEGIVKRYAKEGSRQFLYQLVDGENCSHHFHLKCMVCGKLIHLSEEGSRQIIQLALGEAGFSVDQEKTILFGKCSECK